jgi:magnesium transporter
VAVVRVSWLEDGQVMSGDMAALDAACASGSWCWVDVTEPDEQTLGLVGQRFGLHPLEVEDILHKQHRPKLDLFPDRLHMVWIAPQLRDGGAIEFAELDVVIGPGHLITAHLGTIQAIDLEVSDGVESFQRGPDWILHGIIDRIVDDVLPVVDRLGERLDGIEEVVIVDPRPESLQQLHELRRGLVEVHRVVAPERDVLRALARERSVISEDAYRYFLDVGDHLARVDDAIETYRDVAASVMDIYLSAQSNRMNQIMKQLTVVATIFMPLTLLSGIYGMNVSVVTKGGFGMWPPPTMWWSFWLVISTMLAIALGMLWYFRRKEWW